MRRILALSTMVVAANFMASTAHAAGAPQIGEIFWHPERNHCALRASGTPPPDPADPESWRYLFVTELVSDDLTSAERGYVRLDGLLRELTLQDRRQTEAGEKRVYITFGETPVTVSLDMSVVDSEKSKLGQTILVHYKGFMTVRRGEAMRLTAFAGKCGVSPES